MCRDRHEKSCVLLTEQVQNNHWNSGGTRKPSLNNFREKWKRKMEE
jgi:hypothetical protein